MHWSTYIQKQPTGNIILNIFSSEKVMCSKQIFLLSPLATEDVFYKNVFFPGKNLMCSARNTVLY